MIRARWSAQLHGTSLLRTAFAWESLIDEAVFILGPPLATIVALQVAPSAALILATTLLIIGTLLLLTQKSTEPKPSGRHGGTKGRPAIFLPGVGGIAAIFVMLGGIFGSFEVTTVAFARQAGVPERRRPGARPVCGRVADRRSDLRGAGAAGVAGPAVHGRGHRAGRGHVAAAVPGLDLAGCHRAVRGRHRLLTGADLRHGAGRTDRAQRHGSPSR